MPILLDEILSEYADHVFEAARLGRNGVHKPRDLIFSEMLVQFEASGDTMWVLGPKGRIVWKATPNLRQYLKDLELDAQEDFEVF
jgi:hypothetical protein